MAGAAGGPAKKGSVGALPDHRKYSVHNGHQFFMTNELQQVAKKMSRTSARMSITGGRSMETPTQRRLFLVALIEILSAAIDCVLCLAFTDLNSPDPLGLLQQLATLRKLLDFWAFYALGMWAFFCLYKAAQEREREKTLPFLGWKCLQVAINAIGLVTFLGTTIYLETKKNKDYQAYITLTTARTYILGLEIGVQTLVIISCVKTWVVLCVGIGVIIYLIKLRRAHCFPAALAHHLPQHRHSSVTSGNISNNSSSPTPERESSVVGPSSRMSEKQRNASCVTFEDERGRFFSASPNDDDDDKEEEDEAKPSKPGGLVKTLRESFRRLNPTAKTSPRKDDDDDTPRRRRKPRQAKRSESPCSSVELPAPHSALMAAEEARDASPNSVVLVQSDPDERASLESLPPI